MEHVVFVLRLGNKSVKARCHRKHLGNNAGTKALPEPEYFPHVFQQSVTLTAKMWHGGNNTGSNEEWRWHGWRLPPEYAPLLVGLCCGIAVVLLAISAAVVWRCIIIPNRKKDSCSNIYEEVIPHSATNGSIPVSRDSAVIALRSGHGCQSRLVDRSSTIYRSATLGAMPMDNCMCETVSAKRKSLRPTSQSLADDIESQALLHGVIPTFRPRPNVATYQDGEEVAKERSKSTPALEELYAKVNFSKKRKNRMRKDEAAIIALSKSRSGTGNDSIALADAAVVVYNERTAL